MEVKPNVQTYICLLHACAAQGRIDRVYVILLLFYYIFTTNKRMTQRKHAIFNNFVSVQNVILVFLFLH